MNGQGTGRRRGPLKISRINSAAAAGGHQVGGSKDSNKCVSGLEWKSRSDSEELERKARTGLCVGQRHKEEKKEKGPG